MVFYIYMGNLFTSNVLNYQSVIEFNFEIFLKRHGCSDKTRRNYRSDLRNFFDWLIQTILSTQFTHLNVGHLVQATTIESISGYKISLTESSTPHATINRRLSAVRMFCECAVENSWMQTNPAAVVPNVVSKKLSAIETDSQMLKDFETYLKSGGAARTTIRSYINDIREFLTWYATENQTVIAKQ